MSFLAPVWLALGALVAVPLVLHLMRRRVESRREFPAVRYLVRAEKENVRRLRLRNLLLMILRALAVAFLAMAAARPIGSLLGAGHVPTAMAIVLDNSMSSGVVVNGVPLLDQFKSVARRILQGAGASDQVWVVTAAGVAAGGARQTVMDALDGAEPIGGRGDLGAAVTHAASLVLSARLPASVVVVLTDAQASQWTDDVSPGNVRVVVYSPPGEAPANRGVSLAEPRPPRWSPSGTLLVRASGADSVTFRVTLGDRTVSRGLLRGNDEYLVRAEPPDRGWIAGSVELAPDELRGDDIRYFAVWAGDAPAVSVNPSAGLFAQEAVDALVQNQLVRRGNGIALAPVEAASSLPALLLAPSDPVRVGAANRVLEQLGVPWRLGDVRKDETLAHGPGLEGTPVRMRYRLTATPGAGSDTLATAGEDAWIVAGENWVLVASPLTVEATGLPIRTGFLPWLTGLLTQRLAHEGALVLHADPGGPVRIPDGVTGLESGDGQVSPLPAGGVAPLRAGIWFLRRGDERIGALVVNPEPDESLLGRLSVNDVASRIRVRSVDATQAADEVAPAAFDSSAGRPLQLILLLLALACLAVEMVIVHRAEPRGQRKAA